MEKGAVFFAKQADTYVIKLTGEIRYQLSCSFDDFLKMLFARNDFHDILVDMTEAVTIDSTCLGLLAKIANFSKNHSGRKTTIFSTNDDINRILNSVGFYAIFNICNAYPATPTCLEEMATSGSDKEQFARTIYEAHCILSELNEKNRNAFRSVLEVLREKVDPH